ncbi:hypothetical protein ACLOJK_035728 [Asimina triloba]
MYGIWVSLKQNLSCRSTESSHIFLPQKSKGRNRNVPKRASTRATMSGQPRLVLAEAAQGDVQRLHSIGHGHPMVEFLEHSWSSAGGNIPMAWIDLSNGDASRNIIEMIFQTSSSASGDNRPRKINRVLKVKHSLETLKRFESYRESVKKRARGQRLMHPRSIVDGNELLLFCTTTMSCCPKRKSTKVSDLCSGSSCKVCRIIRSGFEIMNTNMIAMSTSCCDVAARRGDGLIKGVKGDDGKCAVVVCRVIAGTVVDVSDGASEEGFDSVGSCGLDGKVDHFFIRDPRAILPSWIASMHLSVYIACWRVLNRQTRK